MSELTQRGASKGERAGFAALGGKGPRAWHVAIPVDGPQMAPAIRRGERGPGSQAELGRGLRREIQTCLVTSDEKTLWNAGPPGGLSQRQPSAAARARGRRCRKQGGKLVPLPTWADSRPLGFPEQLRDASCQLPERPGGRPGSGRCRALRRVPAAFPPSSKCYVGFSEAPFSSLPLSVLCFPSKAAASPLPDDARVSTSGDSPTSCPPPPPDCHTPLTPEAPIHTPLCSSRRWEQHSLLQPLPFLTPHPARRELDLEVRSPDGAMFFSGWALGESNPTLGRAPHLAEAFLFLCLSICALPLLPSHPCCRGGWLSVAQARCCRLLPLWKVICMTLLLQACPTSGLALEGEASLGLKLTWVRVLGTGLRAEAQPITQ